MNVRDDLSKQGAQRRFHLIGDRNQCPACGELFNSSGAFDKHRTGDFSARRCLSVEEMTAKGMVPNETGFWLTHRMSDEAKRARREGADATPNPSQNATSAP